MIFIVNFVKPVHHDDNFPVSIESLMKKFLRQVIIYLPCLPYLPWPQILRTLRHLHRSYIHLIRRSFQLHLSCLDRTFQPTHWVSSVLKDDKNRVKIVVFSDPAASEIIAAPLRKSSNSSSENGFQPSIVCNSPLNCRTIRISNYTFII